MKKCHDGTHYHNHLGINLPRCEQGDLTLYVKGNCQIQEDAQPTNEHMPKAL